jgi:hypothetical protein
MLRQPHNGIERQRKDCGVRLSQLRDRHCVILSR